MAIKSSTPSTTNQGASCHDQATPGWLVFLYLIVSSVAGFGACALTGCERKEKVIDVETPATDVEVERNLDTGEVDVKVERQ